MKDDKIFIGKIGKPFGIKGGLFLRSQEQKDYTLSLNTPLLLELPDKTNQTVVVEDFVGSNRIFLRGVNDFEAAKKYTGAHVYVSLEHLPKPKENEYYLFEIKGFSVQNHESVIGVVSNFFSNGPQELLEVETPNNQRFLVPLVKPLLKEISFAKSRVYLSAPDELFSEELL